MWLIKLIRNKPILSRRKIKLLSAIIVTGVPLVFYTLVCPFNPVIIGTIARIMSRNNRLKKETRMRRLLISGGLNQDTRRSSKKNTLQNPIFSFIRERSSSYFKIDSYLLLEIPDRYLRNLNFYPYYLLPPNIIFTTIFTRILFRK